MNRTLAWLVEQSALAARAAHVVLGVMVWTLEVYGAALARHAEEPEYRTHVATCEPATIEDDGAACVVEGEGLDVGALINGPGAEA